MKNKKGLLGSISFRTKAEVILVACLLVSIGVSSVMSVTRTITDTSDTVFTYIRNSNGNYWTATEANLQTAIDGLDNESGWVSIPSIVDISNAIKVGDECELYSIGGGLKLTNNANCTMITNYDTTNGNSNITIRGLTLEGNGLNQPEWDAWNTHRSNLKHGIFLLNGDNATIENVVVNNTHSSGIFIEKVPYSIITKCRTYNNGKLFKDSGNGYSNYFAKGICYTNCSYSVLTDCIVDNAYASGITLENYGEYGSGVDTYWQHDVVVSDCVVSDSGYGIYVEANKDIRISDCTVSDCIDVQVYAGAAGFFADAASIRVTFSDCIATDCANGFTGSGEWTRYENCHSYRSTDNGFPHYGDNITYIGCSSNSDGATGFLLEVTNAAIKDCDVYNSGTDGIRWSLGDNTLNEWGVIQGCTFVDCGDEALEIHVNNVSVKNNVIRECAGVGIEFYGDNLTINNNDLLMVGGNVIRIIGSNHGMCNNNYIVGSGEWGSGVQLSSSNNFSVIGNTIIAHVANFPDNGVYESGTADYNIILFNHGININTMVTVVGANTKVNCTGLDDWNFS